MAHVMAGSSVETWLNFFTMHTMRRWSGPISSWPGYG